MNLALKKIHLAASLHSVALCCVFLGAGLTGAVAVAQDRYDQGRAQESRDDGRRDARADVRQNAHQDLRAYQREEQRRVNQVQPNENDQERADPRRGARMTADERRDLRRQINEVGQDIYARPPRR